MTIEQSRTQRNSVGMEGTQKFSSLDVLAAC